MILGGLGIKLGGRGNVNDNENVWLYWVRGYFE